ncbi:MAG: UDP-2,3-diacylglucosamine diphosphatase [Gemmatimonadales bacterium]|nr:MAG: UDP-2,3-diacylglucosamine diphosphatase [Gemmatimonadales bacterium]
MSEFASIIVSDAHLGAAPKASETAFHEFLAFACGATQDLVINGDLFDFWFEYRTVVLSRHFRTLKALAKLVDAGVRVRLVGGNHDSWGGAFLTDEIGIELISGPIATDIGGRTTYLAHGDGLGDGDFGYRALKRVIRSRPASYAFRQVHPDWANSLARFVSRTEFRHESPDAGRSRAAHLESHARATLAADSSIQLVALGHCHIPSLIEVYPGRHYLNTGDWIDHCTWAAVGPDEVKLHRWQERD